MRTWGRSSRRPTIRSDSCLSLVATGEIKRRYIGLASRVGRLYRAVLPDIEAQEFRRAVRLLSVLADRIRALTPPVDISVTMKGFEELLAKSIATEGYAIAEPGRYRTDLSKIDFEKLAENRPAGPLADSAGGFRVSVANVPSVGRRHAGRLPRVRRSEMLDRLPESFDTGVRRSAFAFCDHVGREGQTAKTFGTALVDRLLFEQVVLAE